MAYPTWWTAKHSLESCHANSATGSQAVSRQDSNDPVRLARDDWVVQHANVSDSSVIIDSIDIDMVDANQDENSTEIYLVLDTNILIHHLVVLRQALARIEAPNSDLRVVMLVPGIVVSELDFQKNSARGIAVESRRASDWLAGEIGNGRGRVTGQAYSQTMLPSGDWRLRHGFSNDELILDCCKYFGHIKRKDVLLCTSDNNLAVQASSNAGNLFIRGVSAVIRSPRGLWDCRQLLERALPGFGQSTAASMHASGSYSGMRVRQGRAQNLPSAPPQPSPRTPPRFSVRTPEDDVVMEIDLDSNPSLSNGVSQASPKNRRDELHRRVATELGNLLRRLTGSAASLQQYRRAHESVYSPVNAKFTGDLPNEDDWSRAWTLRECLKFVAKIPPPQRRSWTFDEGNASSLADFLGLPGEKGARPGREWAKHDWGRELMTIERLAQDFDFRELDQRQMAEYQYLVMEAFAVD